MRTITIIIAGILSLCCNLQARDIDPKKYSSKLTRFIVDVVFEVEAGNRERHSKRLPSHLKITYHCNPVQKKLCETKLAQFLNASGVSTEGTAKNSEPTATLDIYFGETKDLYKAARKHENEIMLNRGYTYWKWWDTDRRITKALVFICTDKIAGKKLEDKLIEQLFGVFGLPSKSKEAEKTCVGINDSIFTELQPLDLAVIKFCYQNIPAGSTPSEVKKIVREKWPKK